MSEAAASVCFGHCCTVGIAHFGVPFGKTESAPRALYYKLLILQRLCVQRCVRNSFRRGEVGRSY
jgi:hypothetical protein